MKIFKSGVKDEDEFGYVKCMIHVKNRAISEKYRAVKHVPGR